MKRFITIFGIILFLSILTTTLAKTGSFDTKEIASIDMPQSEKEKSKSGALSNIIYCSHLNFLLFDQDFNITEVNEAFYLLTGFSNNKKLQIDIIVKKQK